jgi:hypothetical protein
LRRSSADRVVNEFADIGVAPDPPQRADQPDVPDGVRELRAPRRLEIRQ